MNPTLRILLVLAATTIYLYAPATAARQPSVVLGPCSDKTGSVAGRRLRGQLARALESRHVDLLSYRRYLAAARSKGFTKKNAMGRKAIRRVAGSVGASGVVTCSVRPSGKGTIFTFRLFDSRGKLRLKRNFRRKQPRLSGPLIWRLAGQMAQRLGVRLKTRSRSKTRKESLVLEEPPTIREVNDEPAPDQETLAESTRMTAEVDVVSFYTSNLFLDRSEKYDLAVRPSIELGAEFGDTWSAGYRGELNTYVEHEDLLSHWHQVHLVANPAWGDSDQHDFFSEFSLGTLVNREGHAVLNHVQPSLRTRLSMQPVGWFRWQAEASFSGRWFYDDSPSSSIDARASVALAFTLPSRTTISPRASYGYRHYLEQGETLSGDQSDQQADFGLHLSQGLWNRAGLQLDYSYRMAIGDSRQVQRMFTQAQSTYLGGDFLWSGHQAAVGFKHLIGESADIGFGISFQERAYAGWPALDLDGSSKGYERRDLVLAPRVFFDYVWRQEGSEPNPLLPDIGLRLEYTLTRQWSNSELYDTQVQMVAVSLWHSW
jgi:hypothetical protein